MMKESTWQHPHTFEEAEQYLAERHAAGLFCIDYNVKIGDHDGALMTREEWLDSVESQSFIDYDGMGNEIAEDGTVLGAGPGKHGWIKPSEATRLQPETKYILWYNR
jgi:hypothetical protein